IGRPIRSRCGGPVIESSTTTTFNYPCVLPEAATRSSSDSAGCPVPMTSACRSREECTTPTASRPECSSSSEWGPVTELVTDRDAAIAPRESRWRPLAGSVLALSGMLTTVALMASDASTRFTVLAGGAASLAAGVGLLLALGSFDPNGDTVARTPIQEL